MTHRRGTMSHQMTDNWKALAALWLGGLVWSYAATAGELPSGWKYVQPVRIDRSGLLRFSVPLETLSAARAGLEDLRLSDNNGREMPYLLERPIQPQRTIRPPLSFQVTVKDATTMITLETGLSQALAGVSLQTPTADFLKAVQIEGSNNGITWTVLAQGQPVFRQPNGASMLMVSFPPGVWPWLRLTLDDRRSAPIPVTGAQLHAEAPATAPAEAVEASLRQRTEEPGQTRLSLRLAGVNFTLAGLLIETPEPLFTRAVKLSQQQLIDNELRESVIARDSIYRVAVEGQPSAQNLTCAVDVPVRSRELVLTIQNDDNPPLQLTALKAERRPVYLTFLALQSGPYYLLTGNSQCASPSYDLAALKSDLPGAELVGVTPGALTTNAAFRATEALAEIAALGTPLDVSGWKYRKRVQIGEGGVQQIELDLDVLAHATASLRDLRLIRDGRQVPYVLERSSATRSLLPVVAKADDPKRPAVSRWQVGLSHRSLPISRLTASTSAPYFRRAVRLDEERQDERGNPYRVILASTTWSKNLGRKEAPLALPLSMSPETDKLLLEIENGDNPPLELQNVQLWYPVSRLICKSAPDADTFIYYGNAKVYAPQYDLELVVPRLLASEKFKAALGAEEVLKPGAGASRFAGSAGWIFWSALALVVAGLLFVLFRLLPKPASDS